MSDPRLLDQAVKPPQHVSPQTVAAVAASANTTPHGIQESKRPRTSTKDQDINSITTQQTSPSADRAKAASLKQKYAPSADPTSLLPSSPPQIYLNLLILEASLRSQYLTLRARRRQHIFFFLLLGLYLAWLGYAVFLRPREDGQGYGGSPYWLIDVGQKVGLLGGVMTVLLVWGTGVWERGVRWPRRWVGVTNRGLRVCNLKVVVVRGRWFRTLGSAIATLLPLRSLFGGEARSGSLFAVLEAPADKKSRTISSTAEKKYSPDTGENAYAYRDGYTRPGLREEDIAPGGDTIKLLLLPKHFSPEFRENWEIYRQEYWERENERRAELRKIVRQKEKEARKAPKTAPGTGLQAGWSLRSIFRLSRSSPPSSSLAQRHDHEKSHHSHPSRSSKTDSLGIPKRRRASNLSVGGTHSRSSSKASSRAGTPETDEGSWSTDGRTRTGSRRVRASPAPLVESRLAMSSRPGPIEDTAGGRRRSDRLHEMSSTVKEEAADVDEEVDEQVKVKLEGDGEASTTQQSGTSQDEEKDTVKLKDENDKDKEPKAHTAAKLVKRASSFGHASESDDGASVTSERSTTSS